MPENSIVTNIFPNAPSILDILFITPIATAKIAIEVIIYL